MTPQELKNSILQRAIQGKLVEQRLEEGTGEELYKQIQAEKARLLKEGRLKKEKPLPPITEDEIAFDIPESWKWCYLGEVFNHNTGKAQNSSDNRDGVVRKFITTSNLYWNRFDFSHLKEMKFTEQEIERCSVRKGDLLVCEGGDYGRAAIWEYEEEVCFQNHVHRLRAFVEVEVLFFFHIFYLYKNTGQLRGRGVGIQGLSSGALHEIRIPLPPLAEQKRIVAKIEELMPLVEQYEKAYNRLEQLDKQFPNDMKKSILQLAIQGKLVEQRQEEGTGEELYKQIQSEKARLIKEGKLKKEKPLPPISEDEIPFEIPERWKWCHISDVSVFQEGPGILAVDFRTSGIPLIRISGMQGDNVSLDGCNYLDPQMVNQKWAHFRLDKGDIVISSSASLDKIAEVDDEAVGAIPYTGLIRFKMLRPFSKLFFTCFIKSPCYIDQIAKQEAGSTIKHYGPTHLKRMVIPVPPLAEQKRIVAKIEELLPLCDLLNRRWA